jgi:putative hemolysin
MLLVVDEHGGLQGIVTPTDVLEAIAGDFPQDGSEPAFRELEGGALLIDGSALIYDVQERLGLQALPEGEFNTRAGFVMTLFGRIAVSARRQGGHS